MSNNEAKQKLVKETEQEINAESRENTVTGLLPVLMTQKTKILRHKKNLLEDILARENMQAALRRVKRNKGCPGVDGMSTEELSEYLKLHWLRIKEELFKGSYKPSRLKEVEIPKSGGGKRKLGIPTAIDRLIQQALNQVLQEYVDETFSDSSYGYRPNRSAKEAVKRSKQYIDAGYEYVVDIDIEKFFDTVNQDRLMSCLKSRIGDQRVLNLIRKYLNAGHIVGLKTVGMPQGSPLSPLLSNIYLDALDKELEKRGLKFIRYADDCSIYVKTQRSADRVMQNVSNYIEKKLKLKINQLKSKTGRDGELLGFKVNAKGIYVLPKKIATLKDKIRMLTPIRGGYSMVSMINKLSILLRGWYEYFKIATKVNAFKGLDSWIRRRLRACQYKQYKNGSTREVIFKKAGFSQNISHRCAYASAGSWAMALCMPMRIMLKNNRLEDMGLFFLHRR